jgi:hypothetical protein
VIVYNRTSTNIFDNNSSDKVGGEGGKPVQVIGAQTSRRGKTCTVVPFIHNLHQQLNLLRTMEPCK